MELVEGVRADPEPKRERDDRSDQPHSVDTGRYRSTYDNV